MREDNVRSRLETGHQELKRALKFNEEVLRFRTLSDDSSTGWAGVGDIDGEDGRFARLRHPRTPEVCFSSPAPELRGFEPSPSRKTVPVHPFQSSSTSEDVARNPTPLQGL
mmetsp:Transcript_9894/g.33064  ORF Transcript_9894/g.33064 Transcript_9894/m.33064 type:complete len:111 (+) Transcript_9894:121-453(+)